MRSDSSLTCSRPSVLLARRIAAHEGRTVREIVADMLRERLDRYPAAIRDVLAVGLDELPPATQETAGIPSTYVPGIFDGPSFPDLNDIPELGDGADQNAEIDAIMAELERLMADCGATIEPHALKAPRKPARRP